MDVARITGEEIDEGSRVGWHPLALGAVLLFVAAGGAADLILDAPRSFSKHVAFELVMMALSLTFAIYLWSGWWRASRSLEAVKLHLAAREAEHRAERDAWQASARPALDSLAQAIDAQFAAWNLTAAEREVALLLLKGYGHKQVAAATGRSDRTARQHAVAVYQKAGLSGRAELAAWFLGGL